MERRGDESFFLQFHFLRIYKYTNLHIFFSFVVVLQTVGKLYLAGSGPLTSIAPLAGGYLAVSSFNSGIFIGKFDANPDWTDQALSLISNY